MTCRKLSRLIAFVLSFVFASAVMAQTGDPLPVNRIVSLAEYQYQSYIRQFPDSSRQLYSVTDDNKARSVGIKDWTSGFFPGCLWSLYDFTKKPEWQHNAKKWTGTLEEVKWLTDKHDLGFMMYCSFGKGYQLTKDKNYKDILLQTAHSLSSRFDPVVGCIKSWDKDIWHYPVIVDNLMNLELLFWATAVSGDTSFRHIAVSHINKDLQYRFRADGSTYHVLDYDPATGKLLAQKTWQGYSDSSCWARGQAWAIYGLTMAYRYTQNNNYLEAASKAADYFISQVNRIPDHIPYWDFNDPAIPGTERDVSAAAIAASGLLELSGYNKASSSLYYNAALNMLRSLCTRQYLAKPGTNNHFVLKHSVVNKPSGKGVDVPVIYADYYFLEALKRYRDNKR